MHSSQHSDPEQHHAPHHHHGESAEQWRSRDKLEPELERIHGGVPIQCQFCTGQTFRRSRLRAADLSSLLLLRYPVRCTRCAQRQAVSFTVAGISAASYMRRRDGPPSPSPKRR